MRKRLETVVVAAVHAVKCRARVLPMWSGNRPWVSAAANSDVPATPSLARMCRARGADGSLQGVDEPRRVFPRHASRRGRHGSGGGGVPAGTEAFIGVVVRDRDGETDAILWKHAASAGAVTHNAAEYIAVLAAIRYAVQAGATSLLVKSDSALVVGQVNGRFRVRKPHLADRLEEIHRATEGALDFQLEWIPRAENKEADN